MPVYYPERYDIFEYGTRQTFGWNGPDYRTNWGGYQYRPVLEMIAAMGRLAAGNSTRNLLITNGCLESMVLCLRAVTQPGDIVALESPTYFGFLERISY